jgi:hypothetical protein
MNKLDFVFNYLKSIHTIDVLELYSFLSQAYIKNDDVESAYAVLIIGTSKAIRLNERFEFAVMGIDRRLLQLLKDRHTYDIITTWEKKVMAQEASKKYIIKRYRNKMMRSKQEQRYFLVNQERSLKQLERKMHRQYFLDLQNVNLLKEVHDSIGRGDWKFFLENSKAFTIELFPDRMIAWHMLVENLYESGNKVAAREITKHYRDNFFIKLAPTGYFGFNHYINSFVESILKFESWEYSIDILKEYGKLFPWTSSGPVISNEDIEKLYHMFKEQKNRPLALRFLNVFKSWPSEYDNILDELSMHAFKDKKYSLSFYFCLRCSTPQTAMWSIISSFLISYDDNKDYSKFLSFIKDRESYFKFK